MFNELMETKTKVELLELINKHLEENRYAMYKNILLSEKNKPYNNNN